MSTMYGRQPEPSELIATPLNQLINAIACAQSNRPVLPNLLAIPFGINATEKAFKLINSEPRRSQIPWVILSNQEKEYRSILLVQYLYLCIQWMELIH